MRFKYVAAALAISISSITSGCALLPGYSSGPCHVDGATEAETPKLCVIRAAQVVRGSYATIGDQLTRGAITADQAAIAKAQVDQAAAAVDTAAAALPVIQGTTDERLTFLEGLILTLLRAQAAQQ